MKQILVVLTALLALCLASSAYAAGDAAKGKVIFTQSCALCHMIGPGAAIRIGPPLTGVVGRKWATFPGYSYSPALAAGGAKGNIWDEASLDKWLTHPATFVPGTKMTFVGLSSAQQRQDVIAYMKTFDAKK
jgi:cytochrome c